MTHEIWEDLRIRMTNIRADMVGQWQGDFDNVNIEHGVTALGSAIQVWASAEPPAPPPDLPPGQIPLE